MRPMTDDDNKFSKNIFMPLSRAIVNFSKHIGEIHRDGLFIPKRIISPGGNFLARFRPLLQHHAKCL